MCAITGWDKGAGGHVSGPRGRVRTRVVDGRPHRIIIEDASIGVHHW